MDEFYDFPFKALKYLLDEGIYASVAMTDLRVMQKKKGNFNSKIE